MGLDGVEIIMRTEEAFGIQIPNEVAAQLLTPAALVDFVAANVPLKPTDECLSQQLFYRLRRGFPVPAEGALFDLGLGNSLEGDLTQGSMAAGLGGNPR